MSQCLSSRSCMLIRKVSGASPLLAPAPSQGHVNKLSVWFSAIKLKQCILWFSVIYMLSWWWMYMSKHSLQVKSLQPCQWTDVSFRQRLKAGATYKDTFILLLLFFKSGIKSGNVYKGFIFIKGRSPLVKLIHSYMHRSTYINIFSLQLQSKFCTNSKLQFVSNPYCFCITDCMFCYTSVYLICYLFVLCPFELIKALKTRANLGQIRALSRNLFWAPPY